jgi:hypothetical protein
VPPSGPPGGTGSAVPAPTAETRAATADPVRPDGPGAAADGAVPAQLDVHAERDTDDPSITITWTAGGSQAVEYKVTRLTPDGGGRVVGRTGATSIIDGAVPSDAAVPVYEVVARLGRQVSDAARSAAAAPPDPGPGGVPAVRALTVSASGTLVFDWPDGVTEAMVVVRRDRPPMSPDDPAATSWKITNMRYQLDGGLLLPASVQPPCHVAVASCRRERGALVVSPGFGASARVSVEG